MADMSADQPSSRLKFRGFLSPKWIAVAICVLLLLWYRFDPPLNQYERQLVGHWQRELVLEDKVLNQTYSFDSNRKWILSMIIETKATESSKATVMEGGNFGNWSVKNGQLILKPKRSARRRLQLLSLRIQSGLSNKPFINNEESEGRIKFLSPDKWEIEWYDPNSGKYHPNDDPPWTATSKTPMEL